MSTRYGKHRIDPEDILASQREFVGLKLSSQIVKKIEAEAKRKGIKKTQMIRIALHERFMK